MGFNRVIKNVAAVASMALILAGCKTTDSGEGSALLDSSTPTHKILLIGSGGWGSCSTGDSPYGQRIFDSFALLAKDLSANAKVDYLVSCSGPVSPAKLVANLWYGGPDGQVWRIKARDFPTYIQEHINKTKPTQVYMFGHSYGGWIVLNAAEAGIRSQAIFAFDPIDAASCLPVNNFFLGLGIESSRCKKAPSFDYNKISRSTQRLYQYWQPLGPIRSQPLNLNFVVNQEFDINHASFRGLQVEKVTYAHRMIGSDPSAWGAACKAIFKINGWSPSGCRMMESDGEGKFVRFVTPTTPDLETTGITIPAPVVDGPTPGGRRLTCTKNPVGPQGQPIAWRVSIVQGNGGWLMDAKRNQEHLYDERETSRVLFEQSTASGLINVVHPSNTLWLSLAPQSNGRYIGRFYTQKHNYDIRDMECAFE